MNASDVLQRFGELPFVLELELGTLSMTIGEIFQLQEGSVLRTDHPAGAPFPLYASNVKLAEAEIIVIDNTVSVRIQKMLKKGAAAGHVTNSAGGKATK